MALRDLSFINYIEAAFRHKLFKDPNATYFNYLGYNLAYKTGGGKKGIFEYSRKVLPFAYTNEFADTDSGNLQMARAVIEKLDKEGKDLGVFIEPTQVPQEYDSVVADAKQQSEQAQAVPAAAGGETPSTMLGGIPSTGVQGGIRTMRVPQTKPPVETAETPESKLYVADKTGRVVQERTITPASTTVTKQEAESKLFIADRSGRVVGERVIKNVGSATQIGIKKGLARVGSGLSGMLGGIAGGGGRFFGKVALGGADAMVRFSNQISRGSIMKGLPSKKFALLFLGGFLLLTFGVGLTGTPGPGGPGGPSPSPGTTPQPTPQPPPVTVAASCPVIGGTISTASYTGDPVRGHCSPGYRGCRPECRTTGRRAKAIDVRTDGQDVILPTVQRQTIQWTLINPPYSIAADDGGGWGYTFRSTYGGDTWYIDMLHLLPSSTVVKDGIYPSSHAIGKVDAEALRRVGSEPHVHTTIGKNLTTPVSPGSLNTDCDSNWLASDFMCK